MDLSNSKEDQRFTIKVDGRTFHIDPKEPIPMSLTQRAGRIDGGKKKSEKVCHIVVFAICKSAVFYFLHACREVTNVIPFGSVACVFFFICMTYFRIPISA